MGLCKIVGGPNQRLFLSFSQQTLFSLSFSDSHFRLSAQSPLFYFLPLSLSSSSSSSSISVLPPHFLSPLDLFPYSSTHYNSPCSPFLHPLLFNSSQPIIRFVSFNKGTEVSLWLIYFLN